MSPLPNKRIQVHLIHRRRWLVFSYARESALMREENKSGEEGRSVSLESVANNSAETKRKHIEIHLLVQVSKPIRFQGFELAVYY